MFSIKTRMNSHSFLCIAISFLLFSYPFYASNVLPMRLTLLFFCAGAVFIFVLCVQKCCIDQKKLGVLLLWLIAALIVIFSFVFSQYDYEFSRFFYPICLAVSIICSLLCSGLSGWVMSSLKTIVIMLIPFAVGTVFLYFFQDVYPFIKSLLFPNSIFATGYKSGLATHYSYNGTYNITGFLISFGLALYSSGKKGERRGWLIVALLFLFALLLIGKRQTLLFGSFTIFAVYLISNEKNKYRRLLFAGVLFILLSMLAALWIPGVAESLDRLLSSFGDDDVASVTSGRDVIWDAAFSGWSESVLFGNGWGTFTYQFSATNTVHVAHNELLDLLYGVGLIGAMVFVACTFATLVITIRLFRESGKNNDESCLPHLKPMLAISLMIQIYSLSMSFTIGSLFGSPSAFMPYFLAVAIAAYCYRRIPKALGGRLALSRLTSAHFERRERYGDYHTNY